MKIVIDIPEELKHKISLMGLDRLEKKDISEVSKMISKGTPLEKEFEDIKTEIKEEIKHWELRKPPIEETKVEYTSCVNSEHSTKIRNSKEIEYMRYAERIGGLDIALEIIDNHISGKEQE